jgi:hypothetical protein
MKKNNKEKIIKNHKLFYSEFCQDKNKQNKNEQDKKYKY